MISDVQTPLVILAVQYVLYSVLRLHRMHTRFISTCTVVRGEADTVSPLQIDTIKPKYVRQRTQVLLGVQYNLSMTPAPVLPDFFAALQEWVCGQRSSNNRITGTT